MIKITQRSMRVPFVTLKKGKRTIEVRGAVHIAERQFFRELYRTGSVIHHEAICHTNQVNYSLMIANAFGLDSQKDHIPKRKNILFRDDLSKVYDHLRNKPADVLRDAQRQVIEMSTQAKKIPVSRYFLISKKNLRRMCASDVGRVLIVERDETATLHADLAEDKNVVLVWGAAHVSGIVKNLQSLGWKRKSTRWVSAVYFSYKQGEKNEK